MSLFQDILEKATTDEYKTIYDLLDALVDDDIPQQLYDEKELEVRKIAAKYDYIFNGN